MRKPKKPKGMENLRAATRQRMQLIRQMDQAGIPLEGDIVKTLLRQGYSQHAGKTTLAERRCSLYAVIANHQTKSHFETLSAVLAGKAELREAIDKALERRRLYATRTILFVKDIVETLNQAFT